MGRKTSTNKYLLLQICTCCGKEYLAKTKKALYCSDKCKDLINKSKDSYIEAQKKRANQYRQENLALCRERDRQRYSKNKEYFFSNNAARRHKIKQTCPIWANKKEIVSIYKKARLLNDDAGYVKYHVDHVIPLRGKLVCGLHVENNLCIIEAKDNLKKGISYAIYEKS